MQRKIWLFFIITGLMAIGCGSKKGDVRRESGQAQASQDSLLQRLDAAREQAQSSRRIVSLQQLADSGQAQSGAMPRYSQSVLDQGAGDTVETLEDAERTGASVIQVDSGSAEDRRLDSLMMIAAILSDNYRRWAMNHTHRNLAAQAHQNPAKQVRLLTTIASKSEQRRKAAEKAALERQRRIDEKLGRR